MILPSPTSASLATAPNTLFHLLEHVVTTASPSPSPSPTSPGGGGGGISYPENWNSIIGIVTAIIGNVMISFALNMQRYAHIRLEREWQEKEKRRKRWRNRSYRSNTGDGLKTRKTGRSRESVNEGYAGAASEEDPLLGAGTGNRRSSARASSRPILRPIGEQEEEGVEGEDIAYKQKSYLQSPYWWAGIILMTTGEAGNFLAYGFAPASIVSPLGVVALVSNCIIAPLMLKEPYRKRDGLGVLIAVGGAVTVVLSANDNNPKLGPDEIWELISTWEFETYLGITVAIMAGLMVASNRFGEKNILVDLGLVGLFGGYTALSTKGVASMLSYTLWRAITFPVTYLLVAILVVTAVMQIKYVNRALQRFDATQVIPVQFVLFTLSVILGSAILYRDFERTSGDDAGKFVGGCAMTFLGVWLITSGRPPRESDDDDDRDPEPEDAINLIEERYRDEVDGPNDAPSASRHSSTTRAMSPPINIASTSTQDISQPNTLDIAFTPQNSVPRTPTTPQAPDIPTPLTQNPWDDPSFESLSRFRPENITRHSALSTPALPSYATEPTRPSTSSPELSLPHPNPPMPSTPTRNQSDTAFVSPTAPSTLPPRLRRMGSERPAGRNSIPGPLLASPLSTSLSAMVADLKRGGSLSKRTSRADIRGEEGRRRQSVLGMGPGELVDDNFGELLDRRRIVTGEEERGAGGGNGIVRGRSLSGTLGDLWRGFRGGPDEEEHDVEGGRVDGDRESER
ncbi:DUF803-domain-containing protein [Massarina eburnea CBS 473.64]|uniref:DUF803-domain-containing protein n=1 Tax=Massarina eburnea CBS 473.64 TaxID=1395130 RepID=A0A6A6RXK5_9PLEO|nr:DUF803-domain-containing protein [Massarina eburnea CBS 473.64]